MKTLFSVLIYIVAGAAFWIPSVAIHAIRGTKFCGSIYDLIAISLLPVAAAIVTLGGNRSAADRWLSVRDNCCVDVMLNLVCWAIHDGGGCKFLRWRLCPTRWRANIHLTYSTIRTFYVDDERL